MEKDIFQCSLSFRAEHFRLEFREFIKLLSRAFVYFVSTKLLQIFSVHYYNQHYVKSRRIELHLRGDFRNLRQNI